MSAHLRLQSSNGTKQCHAVSPMLKSNRWPRSAHGVPEAAHSMCCFCCKLDPISANASHLMPIMPDSAAQQQLDRTHGTHYHWCMWLWLMPTPDATSQLTMLRNNLAMMLQALGRQHALESATTAQQRNQQKVQPTSSHAWPKMRGQVCRQGGHMSKHNQLQVWALSQKCWQL